MARGCHSPTPDPRNPAARTVFSRALFVFRSRAVLTISEKGVCTTPERRHRHPPETPLPGQSYDWLCHCPAALQQNGLLASFPQQQTSYGIEIAASALIWIERVPAGVIDGYIEQGQYRGTSRKRR